MLLHFGGSILRENSFGKCEKCKIGGKDYLIPIIDNSYQNSGGRNPIGPKVGKLRLKRLFAASKENSIKKAKRT